MRILKAVTILLIVTLLGGCCSFCGGGRETVALINCGAMNDHTAPDGRVWSADKMYISGQTVLRMTTEIQNTEDDFIYLTERYNLPSYTIPLENGSYLLKLHFAETFYDIFNEGDRVFTVKVEGEPVLVDFDPLAVAGGNFIAVVKTIQVTVADGELNISFDAKHQAPMINGIEILK